MCRLKLKLILKGSEGEVECIAHDTTTSQEELKAKVARKFGGRALNVFYEQEGGLCPLLNEEDYKVNPRAGPKNALWPCCYAPSGLCIAAMEHTKYAATCCSIWGPAFPHFCRGNRSP